MLKRAPILNTILRTLLDAKTEVGKLSGNEIIYDDENENVKSHISTKPTGNTQASIYLFGSLHNCPTG